MTQRSLLAAVKNISIKFNSVELVDPDKSISLISACAKLSSWSSCNGCGRVVEKSTLEWRDVILENGKIVSLPTLKGGKIRGYTYRDYHGDYEEEVFYGEVVVSYDIIRQEDVCPLGLDIA